MPHTIIKSINNNKWTISILEHSTYVLTINNPIIKPHKIFNIGDFTIYEIQIIRNDTEQQINYSFKNTSSEQTTSSEQITSSDKTTSEKNTYKIIIPALGSNINILYTSCNQNYQKDVWTKIKSQHEKSPYHINIGGGDQIYEINDIYPNGIFGLKSLKKWLKLEDNYRCNAEFTKEMATEVDEFYLSNYYNKFFKSPEHVDILPNIPGIYMWDDHEIFDGYGSYPDYIQNCMVMTNIFKIAKKYFCMFQLHMDIIDPTINSTSFYKLDNTLLINIDTRSNRTINKIIPDSIYGEIFKRIKQTDATNILLNVSTPFIYIDGDIVQNLVEESIVFKSLPMFKKNFNMFRIPELMDDLVDSWSDSNHIDERHYFISNLFKLIKNKPPDKATNIYVLTGDVHVGGYGEIRFEDKVIKQYISSAIGSKGMSNSMSEIIKLKYDTDHTYNNIHYKLFKKTLDVRFNWLQINLGPKTIDFTRYNNKVEINNKPKINKSENSFCTIS
jgi:hypothetical protein